MFRQLFPAAALVAVLGWVASGAQPEKQPDKGPPQPPPAKADPKSDGTVFELRTLDDTVMKVVLLEPSVTLVTRYGKLSIPATEVRRLEFGFRYPEGIETKIDKALADLGSMEFRTREDAEQALAEIGHFAIPTLRRTVKSATDPEVIRRAQAVLKLLESKQGDNKFEVRDYDTVETAEFTVKGKLELAALKVRTKYFGDTTVKLTDIKAFRSVGSASGAEFSLDAGKYAKTTQTDWLETSIEVSTGQQFEVTASGKIDQWPQGPGQYMSEAGGLPGYIGRVGPNGLPQIGLPGQIVGKIGANGTPFAVGAAYKGKAGDNGKLYLRIGPSPWNCDSTGSYKVKVDVTGP